MLCPPKIQFLRSAALSTFKNNLILKHSNEGRKECPVSKWEVRKIWSSRKMSEGRANFLRLPLVVVPLEMTLFNLFCRSFSVPVILLCSAKCQRTAFIWFEHPLLYGKIFGQRNEYYLCRSTESMFYELRRRREFQENEELALRSFMLNYSFVKWHRQKHILPSWWIDILALFENFLVPMLLCLIDLVWCEFVLLIQLSGVRALSCSLFRSSIGTVNERDAFRGRVFIMNYGFENIMTWVER